MCAVGGCGDGMGLRGNLRLVSGRGFSWMGTEGANLEQSKVLVNSGIREQELRCAQSASRVCVRLEIMSAGRGPSEPTRSHRISKCGRGVPIG